MPLDRPPFEAYAVTCGVTFTYGGVKIDARANVLDTADRSIDGLYSAGEMVGGIFYFNYPGGSGLTNGTVFGRIAGREAARHATP
jgi:tricarballylate dehydrogenase